MSRYLMRRRLAPASPRDSTRKEDAEKHNDVVFYIAIVGGVIVLIGMPLILAALAVLG